MRHLPTLAAVAALAVASSARAGEPLAAAAPIAIPAGPGSAAAPLDAGARPAPRLRLLGLQLNGGVPDGGVVSLVVRPLRWVRLDAGLAYNYLNLGAQGGVTLVPFHWAIVPTLRLEAGRFFRSNVGAKVARFADDVPAYLQPMLDGFGYDHASAQLGLEIGSQRSFVFYVRGGIAWVRGAFGDGRGLRDEGSPNTEVDVTGLTVTATGPTVNLGFLFYVW
jgi:hypothetical protein